MAVTIKQIAQMAGVSRGTVDRVIHNRPGVNEDIRKSVQKIIEEMEYRPNQVAKALKTAEKALQFGLIVPTISNEFFLDIEAGVTQAIQHYTSYGVRINKLSVDMNQQQYLQALDQLLAQQPAGLIVAALDTPLIRQRMNVIAKEIPVITYNTDFTGVERLCFVGQDHLAAGHVAGDLMVRTLRQPGKVATFISMRTMLAHTQRVSAFVESLKGDPRITIIGPIEVCEKDEIAYQAVRKIIDATPDLVGIYVAGGGQRGAAQGVYDSGRYEQLTVISCDLQPTVVELVSQGVIDFTIAQDPFAQGYMPIKLMYEYLALNILPKQEKMHTPIDIRMRDNVGFKGFELYT